MEFRQLETFLVVAEELHFTRASERLHLAQSSVSAQVRALEESLDVRLFDRLGRSVVLTDAGEKLRDYARRIREMSSEILSVVREGGEPQGCLTIRVPESLASWAMPEVVARFNAEMPHVRLNFINCTDQRLKEELGSGRVDLAFLVVDSLIFSGVHSEMLRDEELVLAAAPSHPLANASGLTPSSLEGQTLLLPRTD